MTSTDSMKIFAFYLEAKAKGSDPGSVKTIDGVKIRVGVDGYDVERKLINEVEGLDGIVPGSTRIVRKHSITLEDMCAQMRPELEDMVKNSKTKSDLLDLIGKLPVD